MAVSDAVRTALNLTNFRFPEHVIVERIEGEDYVDSSGEDSLRLLIVLSDKTDLERLSGADVGEMKFAIRESLRRQGVNLFPYIFLATTSELAEPEPASSAD